MDHRIPLCIRPGLWRSPMGCVTANRRNRPSSFWQREGRTGRKSALAWAQGQAHIIQYDKREGTTHININTYWPCNGPAFQKRRLEGKEILFGGAGRCRAKIEGVRLATSCLMATFALRLRNKCQSNILLES